MAQKALFIFCGFCKGYYNFRTFEGHGIAVKSFKNGIISIDAQEGQWLYELADDVAKCFSKESNFSYELAMALESPEMVVFDSIHLKLNDVTVVVTKENADKDKIYDEWQKKSYTDPTKLFVTQS